MNWGCEGWAAVRLTIGWSVRLRQASPLKYSTLKSEVPRFDAKYYGASVRWPRLRPSSSRRAAQWRPGVACRESGAIARAACLFPTLSLFHAGCCAQTCKTEVYDINHGHKTDLATGVEKSARLLSSTRGTKDRFKVRSSCRVLEPPREWAVA
eukprot:COSAG02_NODE_2288_length_9212_cov_11.304071_4_plen_153_part_00